MDNKKIIEIKKLNVSFGNNQVLKNLNLEIYKGEILGIAGMSGSGKTTLLNSLSGLVKFKKGEIIYNLNDEKYDLHKKYRHIKNFIGYSFQTPCLYNELSVYENLDYFSSIFGIKKEIRTQIINTITRLVDLSHYLNKRSGSLSGGMKRRLDIALALSHNPKVLLLDEPTSDLDPILREKIWSLIQKINHNGTTIIISSHYLSELENFCDRVALLHKNRIMKILKNNSKEFLNEEWIQLTLKDRNYKELIKELNDSMDMIIAIGMKGDSLLIKTQFPEKVLENVLKKVKKLGFEIESIERITPSIEDMFKETLKQ